MEVHKVLSQRDKPITIHRLSGLRAELVGRNVEMAELSEAVDNLRQGKGRIFSICGAAGTGKSRLVEEFKAGLDLEQIQWIEGHAYAYSQDIPYFPLVDLLNRLLHIEENDPPEKVREKVESGLQSLVGNQEDIIPYVGGLYSLSYPETNDVSPEFWKSRLQDGNPGDSCSSCQKSADRLLSGGFALGRSLLCGVAATCMFRDPATCHCAVCVPADIQSFHGPSGKQYRQ